MHGCRNQYHQSMARSAALGLLCTDLGWKQQSESQSMWPSPVRITLPFGMPTIFQRRSSPQVTKMSSWGCTAILHKEIEKSEHKNVEQWNDTDDTIFWELVYKLEEIDATFSFTSNDDSYPIAINLKQWHQVTDSLFERFSGWFKRLYTSVNVFRIGTLVFTLDGTNYANDLYVRALGPVFMLNT